MSGPDGGTLTIGTILSGRLLTSGGFGSCGPAFETVISCWAMRATYDDRALAIYIYINEDVPVVRTVMESDGINVDYGANGVIVGYEFLLTEHLADIY